MLLTPDIGFLTRGWRKPTTTGEIAFSAAISIAATAVFITVIIAQPHRYYIAIPVLVLSLAIVALLQPTLFPNTGHPAAGKTDRPASPKEQNQ